MSLFRDKPIRSKKYRYWVAQLPCASCGIANDTVIPHHLIGVGQGVMGGKACDLNLMPLCFDCHQEVHLHSTKNMRKEQYRWICETLQKAIKEGNLSALLA